MALSILPVNGVYGVHPVIPPPPELVQLGLADRELVIWACKTIWQPLAGARLTASGVFDRKRPFFIVKLYLKQLGHFPLKKMLLTSPLSVWHLPFCQLPEGVHARIPDRHLILYLTTQKLRGRLMIHDTKPIEKFFITRFIDRFLNLNDWVTLGGIGGNEGTAAATAGRAVTRSGVGRRHAKNERENLTRTL